MTGSPIDTVLALIAEAVAHRYWLRPLPEITPDTQLADVGADSLDLVTVALACEERFHLPEICSAEIARWTCSDDVLRSVAMRSALA